MGRVRRASRKRSSTVSRYDGDRLVPLYLELLAEVKPLEVEAAAMTLAES